MSCHIIISLKHTKKTDEYMTLWRPDNKGYCYALENAGLYEKLLKDYHDTENDMPITEDRAVRMSAQVSYESGELVRVIYNTPSTHRMLGLKWKKGNLVRTNQ